MKGKVEPSENKQLDTNSHRETFILNQKYIKLTDIGSCENWGGGGAEWEWVSKIMASKIFQTLGMLFQQIN